MSLTLSGDASHITTPLTATIAGMANNGSGAIRVQTSAPHLFATGDYVLIETITTVINAYFSITVIDATHFDLDGSTYTGTGTGTATDASLTPQILVPTDGDAASLQLSGMLSAIQALCDRTQYLRTTQVQRTSQSVFVSASGSVVVPSYATHILLFGCGGGGGGGGGMGGYNGTDNAQFASGGGGAGSQFNAAFTLPFGATKLDVTIGTGGVGGSGSVGAASPGNANVGTDGGTSTVVCHDGVFAGATLARFYGGAGGGAGSNEAHINLAAANFVPVYTPGGPAGPATFFRNPGSKRSRRGPSPAQMFGIENDTGTLSVPSGAWPTRVYTDPVGQMAYCEGGASMASAGDSTFATGVSYDGAPSNNGNLGGVAGTDGTIDTTYIGGAGGGGGGGGGFGRGGAGGNGGNASAAGTPGNGTAGTAGSANTGAGGGGGGGGGNGGAAGGDGAAGGNGGSGAVWIVFLGMSNTP